MTERTLIENLRRGTKLENQAADKIERLTDYTVKQALTLSRFRSALQRIVDEAESDDGLTAWDGGDIAREALTSGLDETCVACGMAKREHMPGGARWGESSLCGVFIPRESVTNGLGSEK